MCWRCSNLTSSALGRHFSRRSCSVRMYWQLRALLRASLTLSLVRFATYWSPTPEAFASTSLGRNCQLRDCMVPTTSKHSEGQPTCKPCSFEQLTSRRLSRTAKLDTAARSRARTRLGLAMGAARIWRPGERCARLSAYCGTRGLPLRTNAANNSVHVSGRITFITTSVGDETAFSVLLAPKFD